MGRKVLNALEKVTRSPAGPQHGGKKTSGAAGEKSVLVRRTRCCHHQDIAAAAAADATTTTAAAATAATTAAALLLQPPRLLCVTTRSKQNEGSWRDHAGSHRHPGRRRPLGLDGTGAPSPQSPQNHTAGEASRPRAAVPRAPLQCVGVRLVVCLTCANLGESILGALSRPPSPHPVRNPSALLGPGPP